MPTGPLACVPWNLITELRGRPVTVCPSASSWLTAWRRAALAWPGASAPVGVPPLLVAGPDLAHASSEATAIAEIYPGSRLLVAESATVSETLAGLDGSPLAHLAAHGHDERENFLFSRLDLADGPLMAYDVQQLAAPPGQVILSACDVGRSVARPGEEILGFTAALLYIGTATVISSIARVADDAAVGVMTAYHRRLTRGAGRPRRSPRPRRQSLSARSSALDQADLRRWPGDGFAGRNMFPGSCIWMTAASSLWLLLRIVSRTSPSAT